MANTYYLVFEKVALVARSTNHPKLYPEDTMEKDVTFGALESYYTYCYRDGYHFWARVGV